MEYDYDKSYEEFQYALEPIIIEKEDELKDAIMRAIAKFEEETDHTIEGITLNVKRAAGSWTNQHWYHIKDKPVVEKVQIKRKDFTGQVRDYVFIAARYIKRIKLTERMKQDLMKLCNL